MLREITAQNKRDAEILLAILHLIKNNGGEMRHADIKDELPKYFQLTEREREPKKTWQEFWHAILGMVGGIEMKAGGIVEIKKGIWSLTKKGEDALKLSPEDFYKLYHYTWLDIQKMRKNVTATDNPIKDTIEEVADKDIESLQTKARDVIRQYIIKKDPYKFQDFVAALLRGMSYHTPFIASKGKDGGIDIIAYRDPLGASGEHIKVQVKHYPDSAVSINIIKELMGNLNKENEVGIVVTSGRFTSECHNEVRRSSKHIRLLDIEDLIDLWLQHYPQMSYEDKEELPLIPIYHLNTGKQ